MTCPCDESYHAEASWRRIWLVRATALSRAEIHVVEVARVVLIRELAADAHASQTREHGFELSRGGGGSRDGGDLPARLTQGHDVRLPRGRGIGRAVIREGGLI